MIVFIDDEGRRMRSYVEELEFSFEDQQVHLETDLDSALKFLSNKEDRQINLIVLDVMMSPGASFQDENTEYGLKTGLLVYRRIRSKNKEVPIVIFTNVSDINIEKELDHDPKSFVLRKKDFLPFEFSEELKRILNS